jgi:hypothetical protein
MSILVPCICQYSLYQQDCEPREYVLVINEECHVHRKTADWLRTVVTETKLEKQIKISGELLSIVEYKRLYKKDIVPV